MHFVRNLLLLTYATCTSPTIQIICPPQFRITFRFSFPPGITAVPKEIENNADANLGAQIRRVMHMEMCKWRT